MSLFVMGDVHGRYLRLCQMLLDAHLVDRQMNWIASEHQLVFLGDFTDRGERGIETLNLVMRLMQQAPKQVRAILGNHDIMLLSAYLFPNEAVKLQTGAVYSQKELWELNGGQSRDLEALTDEHMAWITSLPTMLKFQEHLFVHADSLMYLHYGTTLGKVNQSVRNILESRDFAQWSTLLSRFAERKAFWNDKQNAQKMLNTYGGQRIVHGHTPIFSVQGGTQIAQLKRLVQPLEYADKLCLNVDGGLAHAAADGFLVELDKY